MHELWLHLRQKQGWLVLGGDCFGFLWVQPIDRKKGVLLSRYIFLKKTAALFIRSLIEGEDRQGCIEEFCGIEIVGSIAHRSDGGKALSFIENCHCRRFCCTPQHSNTPPASSNRECDSTRASESSPAHSVDSSTLHFSRDVALPSV